MGPGSSRSRPCYRDRLGYVPWGILPGVERLDDLQVVADEHEVVDGYLTEHGVGDGQGHPHGSQEGRDL